MLDPSLRLLLVLQLKGRIRRLLKGLKTVKGALLMLVGAMLFVPWLLSVFFVPQMGGPEMLEATRRYAPLILFAFCIMHLTTQAGDQSLYFAPAEVTWLFPGPYHPRRLLIYKLASNLIGAAFASLIFFMVLRSRAGSSAGAVVGLFLAMVFLQSFAMLISVLTAAFEGLNYEKRRRWVLLGLAVLAVIVLLPLRSSMGSMSQKELIDQVERAPVMQVVLAPMKVFVGAFLAPGLGPELLGWALAGLAVNAVLIGAILAVRVDFYEAATATSERVTARVQRMRRGGGMAALTVPTRARYSIPMLPSLGGAGAIAWRQLTSASRGLGPLLFRMGISASIFFPLMILNRTGSSVIPLLIGMFTWLAFFLVQTLTFDFRADLDRMEQLKALPIGPTALSLGQLVTPVLLATLFQLLIAVAIVALMPTARSLPPTVLLWLPAANAVLFGIENLTFLWFPTRFQGQGGSLALIGRQVLLMLVKMMVLGAAGGLSALGTLGLNWLGVPQVLSMLVPFVVFSLLAVALVPMIGLAFENFDVARDVPA